MIDNESWKGFTAEDFALQEGERALVFYTLSKESRAALAERANAILAERLKKGIRPPEIYLEDSELTVSRFDSESLWLQKDNAEGMQLRLDEKWWKDNF